MKQALMRGAVAATSLYSLLLATACSTQPKNQLSTRSPELSVAEAFVDAFYSFDPVRLQSALSAAPASSPEILYYQGWAEGGNYIVRERKPCRFEELKVVRCDITVQDDLNPALGTSYYVTDSFHLTFDDGRIVSVRTSDNGPPQFKEALYWLHRERPEVFSGPCRGFFEGGPTPQDCARTVVRGFAEFSAHQRK